MRKGRRIGFLLFLCGLSFISIGSGVFYQDQENLKQKQILDQLTTIKESMQGFYQDENQMTPKLGIQVERINSLKKEIGCLENSDKKNKFQKQIEYLLLFKKIESEQDILQQDLDSNIEIQQSKIDLIEEEYKSLPKSYQIVLKNKLDQIKNTIKQKEEAKKEQQRKEEERRQEEQRQEEQRKYQQLKEASEVILKNVPYISQNQAQVYNGCEVASLLMGLQYRGYLKNVSLQQIANDVPKHETDGYQGFVGDIFNLQPLDQPHWIAPSKLAQFGREYSGYSNVVDISGASVAELKKEIDNGNPVIFYATGNFKEPTNWQGVVPANFHVMLLIGYNSLTGEYIIYDPWTPKDGNGQVRIEKNLFEYRYNQLKNWAVVIR